MWFRRTWIAALVLAACLTGCRDATGPCDLPFACQVPGYDLYFPVFEIVAADHDAGTGLGIIEPDSLDIDFMVRNRGDSVSPPMRVELTYGQVGRYPTPEDAEFWTLAPEDTVSIPALGPGESLYRRVTIETGERGSRPRLGPWEDDRSHAVLRFLEPDADTTNNRLESAAVHVRIAVLNIDVLVEDTAVYVNVPEPVHLSIRNSSRHGEMPEATAGFYLCIYIAPWHCDQVTLPVGFGLHEMQALPPGAEHVRDLDLVVPSVAAWQDEVDQYRIVLALRPPGTPDSVFRYGPYWVDFGGPVVTVHPDYRACQPALLKPDSLVSAPLVCRYPTTFFVFEFIARTDREYDITGQPSLPGATIYRPDGSRVENWFPGEWKHFGTPGTYWVLDFMPRWDATPTRTMMLLERPWPGGAKP